MDFLTFSIIVVIVALAVSFIAKFKTNLKIFFLTAVLTSQSAFFYINHTDHQSQLKEVRVKLDADLQTIASKLELSIRREEGLIRGLASFVEYQDTLNQDMWAQYASGVLKEKSGIRNVGAAPGLVLSYVYPLQGNEKAVGLDFNKNKAQKEAAYQARDLKTFMVAGPIKLVQGGDALIGRLAVMKPDSSPEDSVGSKDKFWGLVSAPIDLEFILNSANLNEYSAQYHIAIRGKDASGPEGQVFYGEERWFNEGRGLSQTTSVKLPYGSWFIVAVPKALPPVTQTIWIFLSALFVMIPMIYFIMQNRYNQQLIAQRVELEEAKDKAVHAAKAKASFLANMSHEIRTPMNGIRGSADLLKDITDDPDKLEYVHLIQSSCDNLLAIINDILDVSKIESGKLELELIPTDYEELINNVIQLFKNQPDSNGNTFEVSYSKDLPKVFEMDRVRVSQVLNNLVSNADKFTQDGKIVVEVRGEVAGGVAQLKTSVKDSGIGMTPGQLDRVFERFQQADSSTTRLFGGTGLGTTISRQLVELMGGLIRAESIEGKGSNFQFQLPLKISHVDVKKIDEATQFQFKGRVLLVEDNVINVKIALKTLKKFGVEAEVAENGQVAVDRALSEDFDLVLMDIQMPVMDGETATKILKDRSYSKPIVALSANAMSEDVKHYREIGMDDVLAKPIERKELIRVLNRFLKV